MGDKCCPKIRCPVVSIRDSAKEREEQRAYCCNGKRGDADGRECGGKDCCSKVERDAIDACCKPRGWRGMFNSSSPPCTAPVLSCASESKDPRCCAEAKVSCVCGSPRGACDCKPAPPAVPCGCAQKCGACCRARESCSCENPCSPCSRPASPTKCCRRGGCPPEGSDCEPSSPCCRPCCQTSDGCPEGGGICSACPVPCSWLSGAICTITAVAAALLIWNKVRDRS